MSWTENVGLWGATVIGGGLLSSAVIGSVLDGAGGDPRGDVALRDDEQQGGGDGGDDGGGHDGVPLLVVVADVVIDAQGDRLVVAAAVEGAGEDEVGPGPEER